MPARSATTGRVAAPMTNGDGRSSPTLRQPTMRAVVHAKFGSADVLQVEEIDQPTIANDEALR